MSLDFGGHLITIIYSDFPKGDVVGMVYDMLRRAGLIPVRFSTSYDVGLRRGEVKYMFLSDIKLPDRAKLEEMLQGINFTELKIEDAVVAQG